MTHGKRITKVIYTTSRKMKKINKKISRLDERKKLIPMTGKRELNQSDF